MCRSINRSMSGYSRARSGYKWSMTNNTTPEAILSFWNDAGAERWFKSDPAFDAEIRQHFASLYEVAAAGGRDDWAATPDGALALVILLDQFPRNMFRGTPGMFIADAKAREIADTAIAAGYDAAVSGELRSFFYLPFMHSERLADQERCVDLMKLHGKQENIKYAEIHLDAIARFGRFPHRNEMLDRESTPAEVEYLANGGFAG